jgi:hypothetical protein
MALEVDHEVFASVGVKTTQPNRPIDDHINSRQGRGHACTGDHAIAIVLILLVGLCVGSLMKGCVVVHQGNSSPHQRCWVVCSHATRQGYANVGDHGKHSQAVQNAEMSSNPSHQIRLRHSDELYKPIMA